MYHMLFTSFGMPCPRLIVLPDHSEIDLFLAGEYSYDPFDGETFDHYLLEI